MKKQNQTRLVSVLMLAVLVLGNLPGMPVKSAHAANQQAAQSAVSVVNINKADAAELDSIRGIGPKLAERIIKFRKEHGNFQKVEDLTQVSGISSAKLEKIKNQITV